MSAPTDLRVRMLDENGAIDWRGSWQDFAIDNDPEDCAEWLEALLRDGSATIGGGAAPLVKLEVEYQATRSDGSTVAVTVPARDDAPAAPVKRKRAVATAAELSSAYMRGWRHAIHNGSCEAECRQRLSERASWVRGFDAGMIDLCNAQDESISKETS